MKVLYESVRRCRIALLCVLVTFSAMLQIAAGPLIVNSASSGIQNEYSQTFVSTSAYADAPRVNVDGERVALNLAMRSVEDAEKEVQEMNAPRLLSARLQSVTRGSDTTSINVGVSRIYMNNCPRLEKITISNSDNGATAGHVTRIEANGCGANTNAVVIDISESELEYLTMNESRVTMATLNSSGLIEVSLSGNRLGAGTNSQTGTGLSAKSSCTNLTRLDLRNNSLSSGSAVLQIGVWSVTKSYSLDVGKSDSTRDINLRPSGPYTWGLPKLTYLNLSGNGITYWMAGGDKSAAWLIFRVRVGNGTAGKQIYTRNTGSMNDPKWGKGNSTNNGSCPVNATEDMEGQDYTFSIDNWTKLRKEPWRQVIVRPFG